MPEAQLLSAVLGLLVGLVLALTGAGGAILAIPLLVFALHLSVSQAAPIALLAIFAATSIGAVHGLYQGTVRYKSAMLIAGLGLLMAPVGVKLAQHLPLQILNLSLAAVLVFVAIRTWQNNRILDTTPAAKPPAACAINPATSKLFWTADCTKRLMLTGEITGLLSGLLGVGGGFIIVPSLQQVSNFNTQTIVATTLAVVAIVSAGSLALHVQTTTVDWTIALPFCVGTTIAMLVMSGLRRFIPNVISQRGFALLCLWAAAYLTVKSL